MFNVLSLYDGTSRAQLALNLAGVNYAHYFACEIDEQAVQHALTVYPDTMQLGPVEELGVQALLPTIDLMLASYPLVAAGGDDGINQVNRLRDIIKPRYFLYDGRGRVIHRETITQALDLECLVVNNRGYWTNITDRPPRADVFGMLEPIFSRTGVMVHFLQYLLKPDRAFFNHNLTEVYDAV